MDLKTARPKTGPAETSGPQDEMEKYHDYKENIKLLFLMYLLVIALF